MRRVAYCLMLLYMVAATPGCQPQYPHASVVSHPDYKKGEALLGKNNDSAFYYFNLVATSSTDSLEIATSYNNMAAIQSDAGDYFGAQETLLSSLHSLDEARERDVYCLASDYNELGLASLNLKNYSTAIEYFNKAIRLARDENYKSIFANNQALALQKTKEYSKSIAIYAALLSKPGTDPRTIARIQTNLARTRWEQDSSYDPKQELWNAMGTRKKEGDEWGLVSSYRHLSDYYTKTHPDSALFYSEALDSLAKKLESPDDELEALQKMIQFGSAKNTQAHFARYHFLTDSLQTARNNAKNQFALIRYEAAKNKADNLVLQTENARKKFQILWQWGLLLLVSIVAAWGILWYRKRQAKIKWEAEKAIRDNELKTSQKVHDVVANGLYRIMTEIEHNPQADLNQLADKMELLYERSRDISYEAPTDSAGKFEQNLRQLIESFASNQTKVLIIGNEPPVWQGIGVRVLEELEKIILELMVNMKKHSNSKNVVVKFERKDNRIIVQYSDDGAGLPGNFIRGNGLTSTENRIKAMRGNINFGSNDKKGFHARFHFPITPV